MVRLPYGTLISLRLGFRRTDRKFLRNRNPPPNFFLYKLILKLGLREKRMLDTSAPVRDILAPRQFGTYVRQFGTRTILIHCIQQSSDIVKLKEVFLPHPFYNVSGLLLKIFSIRFRKWYRF